jgi:hypothetical protein
MGALPRTRLTGRLMIGTARLEASPWSLGCLLALAARELEGGGPGGGGGKCIGGGVVPTGVWPPVGPAEADRLVGGGIYIGSVEGTYTDIRLLGKFMALLFSLVAR